VQSKKTVCRSLFDSADDYVNFPTLGPSRPQDANDFRALSRIAMHVDEDFIPRNVTRTRPWTTCEWHSKECAYRIDTDASDVKSLCKLVRPSNNSRGNFTSGHRDIPTFAVARSPLRGSRVEFLQGSNGKGCSIKRRYRSTTRRSHRNKKTVPRAGVSDTIAYRGKLKLR